MVAVAAQSLLYAKTSKPIGSCSSSTSITFPSFLQCKTSYQSAQNFGFGRLNLHCVASKHQCTTHRNVGVARASSDAGTTSATVAQGWLLEPVGDGDYKHIGFKVDKPGAYEIFSNERIVGRVPGRADLVIPVATVSGLHARIQNVEGMLLVTDLDSTNGTFINEKRVLPGATAIVPPGSLLTFGDTHLAIFRVSRVEKIIEDTATDSEEQQTESNGASAAPQAETS